MKSIVAFAEKFLVLLITTLMLVATLFFVRAEAAVPVWKPFLKPALPPLLLAGKEETPSFFDLQNYLDDAPTGVGAKTVWALPGGRGEFVSIVDVETGFMAKHEDLGSVFHNNSGILSGDHGTAVLGILRGVDNEFGVTGIAPQAQLGFYGFPEGDLDDVNEAYIKGINASISGAVAQMQAGDVLVIEQHMVGPDNQKYTAVEYWPEIFSELKRATDKGIICVEAAGNGNSDFDSSVYEGAFNLKIRDSGCILVGAGSHGAHERLSFSNYGSRIDAHGFGHKVTSTGYGDLFNLSPASQYTQSFSGTSSATPIVAGAVALVSSVAKAKGRVITPLEMREALRATGTPQGSQTQSKRIGNMPDVPALLKYFKLN